MKKFEGRLYHKKQEWCASRESQLKEIEKLVDHFEALDRDYEIKRETIEGKAYYTVIEVME